MAGGDLSGNVRCHAETFIASMAAEHPARAIAWPAGTMHPTGEKARRRKNGYRGRFEGCGAVTSGGDGPRRARALAGAAAHRIGARTAARAWWPPYAHGKKSASAPAPPAATCSSTPV